MVRVIEKKRNIRCVDYSVRYIWRLVLSAYLLYNGNPNYRSAAQVSTILERVCHMFGRDISPTKEKIYRAAVSMFTDDGYSNVSMRDLAKTVGIKHASIYNHFESKKDILLGLYRAYTEKHKTIFPNLDEVYELAEVYPPVELFMMLDYQFPEEHANAMVRILTIAASLMATDADSWRFIQENALTSYQTLTAPVARKLIELGRIEPLDVEAFARLVGYYCFGAVCLVSTPKDAGFDDYEKGLRFLYSSIIRPTGK